MNFIITTHPKSYFYRERITFFLISWACISRFPFREGMDVGRVYTDGTLGLFNDQ
ncbi:MAG: hypothetical protein ACFFBP_14265 [Promethearchaeota archaeon]